MIAAILGFSAVKYRSGAFYNRKVSAETQGYQMDLVFDRDDKVITLCEVKYSKAKISANVINEFDNKLVLLPNQSQKTIQKVLIVNQPPSESLLKQAYFDRFIGLDELFQSVFWEM